MSMLFGGWDFYESINGASWWIASKSDPRWNDSGSCYGGMLSISSACDEAVSKKMKTLGEPPADLP